MILRGERGASRGWHAVLVPAVLAACTAACAAYRDGVWGRVALTGSMPGKLYGHGLATTRGRLYVFGGGISNLTKASSQLVAIDPASGSCSRLDAAAGVTGGPPPQRLHPGFDSWGDLLYVFGGGERPSVLLDDLWEFDTVTLAWRQLNSAAGVVGEPPSKRWFPGFVAHRGYLYVAFGQCSGDACADTRQYHIGTMTWSVLAGGSARVEHSLSALGTALFTFGGDGVITQLQKLELSGARANWSTLTVQGSVPDAVTGGSLAAVGERLLLFGGKSLSLQNTLHEFDLVKNAWSTVMDAGAAPSGRRWFGRAAVMGCSAFFYGGSTEAGRSDELFRYHVVPAGPDDCKCPAGLTGPTGGECRPCPAGTFKIESGNNACIACPPNTFSKALGSNRCASCPRGTHSPEGRAVCCADANAQGSESGGSECRCKAGLVSEGGKLDGMPNGTLVCVNETKQYESAATWVTIHVSKPELQLVPPAAPETNDLPVSSGARADAGIAIIAAVAGAGLMSMVGYIMFMRFRNRK